jgi:hypothetical protein
MPTARVISKRIPTCPGRDSRFTIRRNPDRGGSWWVYYEYPTDTLHPADNPHPELVQLVNTLKDEEVHYEGGGFSINEHGQVIARMNASAGYGGQSIHVVGVNGGVVSTCEEIITFENGTLSPIADALEGAVWSGPLCGISYTFSAPGNPKPPSRNFDEVFVEIEGRIVQLSVDAGVNPYPPVTGPLATFLAALRRRLPTGGRFRVNEQGRAFTSYGNVFIGIVPLPQWFRPLTPLS